MKPFAYEQPPRKNSGKLILMVLAGASFALWHFDLIPHLATVDTGRLDPDGQFDESDFLAMLESPAVQHAPEPNPIVDHADGTPGSSDDPLLSALAADAEPIKNPFPEFGELSEPPIPADNVMPQTAEANASPFGIQQASFETPQTPPTRPAPASIVLDSETAARLRDVDQRLEAGEILESHAILSRLYWKQPEIRPMIQERMDRTAAEIYANPGAHFAEPYEVQFGETLDGIAKKFEIPWQYLARLNGVTPETLQAGQTLKVLKGPFGAVVDMERFEMTIHAHGWFVRRYAIGIGHDNKTPVGEFDVQDKLENPTWYNPDGGVVEGDDPKNPLGEYWLGLGDHIGIHGTIDPSSIGAAASRGCIHLADDDIAEVYQLLGVGSHVVIRD